MWHYTEKHTRRTKRTKSQSTEKSNKNWLPGIKCKEQKYTRVLTNICTENQIYIRKNYYFTEERTRSSGVYVYKYG